MLTALGLALLLGLPLTIGGWLCHQVCHRRLPRRLMWLWLALAGVVALTVVLLATHPGLFPMHGFSGPEDANGYSLTAKRLTGDSWRYISGGQAVRAGRPLEDGQRSYSGYCALVGLLPSSCLIPFQTLMAQLALAALLTLAWRLTRNGLAVVLAGLCVACQPEFAAWHTAVMTESLYMSAVSCNALFAWSAAHSRRRWLWLPLTLAWVALTATLRPTGWIQVPAVALYWSLTLPRGRWPRLVWSALVCASFVGLAVLAGGDAIQRESPARKLYDGEVVWREPLWRVEMPREARAPETLGEGLLYGLRHPVASGWLVCKRLAMMFLRIRPTFSLKHNLFLLLCQVPLTVCGLAALWVWRRRAVVGALVAMLLAHALIVALTFNDNDGRFTLYILPLLMMVAVCGVTLALRRLILGAGASGGRGGAGVGPAAGCR